MLFSSLILASALAFDAGGDLRIRQELMGNVPGLPNGGVMMPLVRDGYTDHMRFRPRVWGELKLGTEDAGTFRLFTRVIDEMRWCVKPSKKQYKFPDEALVDNLFIEGKGLFDGFLDFTVGRQDVYNLYGLDHVFVDGTPGDGSRSVYSDMARMCLHVTETSTLDLFAIYNEDDNALRWGTHRSRHRSLCGFGGGAEPEMDDWGFGAIWGSKVGDWLPYQLFAMQKNVNAFRRGGVKHPRVQRELVGFKLMPQLTDEAIAKPRPSRVGSAPRADRGGRGATALPSFAIAS